jgi:hypothetical protein
LAILVKRWHLELNYATLDLTDRFAVASFQLLDSIDPALFTELLDSGLIPPEALSYALKFVPQTASRQAQLVRLLEVILVDLGIDIYAALALDDFLPETTDRHEWITMSDLHGLISGSTGDFFTTDFSRLIEATFDRLLEIYSFSENYLYQYLELAHAVSFLAHMYCEKCTLLFTKVYADYTAAGKPDRYQRTIRRALARYWNQDLPLASALAISRFAIFCSGRETAATVRNKFVIAAVAVDRELARELANVLPPPVPPMRTFLSFVGLPRYEELVEISQRGFPPGEWILAPGDRELISSLPGEEGLDEIRRVALARLDAVVVPEIETIELPGRVFELKPIEVASIPEKVRPFEPATIANLKSFLWHADGDLADSFSQEKLDNIVFEHASDLDLLSGFFAYAISRRLELDPLHWSSAFPPKPLGSSFVLAVANLLPHVHFPFAELPTPILSLVKTSLRILGFPFTDHSILKLWRSPAAIPSSFARNLMLVDPLHWPLPIIASLQGDSDVLQSYLQADFTLPSLFCALVSVLCPPLPSSSQLLPVFSHPRDLSGPLANLLVAAVGRYAPLSRSWFDLFSQFGFTQPQLAALRRFFALDSVHYPTQFPIESQSAFIGALPSLTRRFLRDRSSAILPAPTPDRFDGIAPILCPVHPALQCGGVASSGIRISQYSFALPALHAGLFDPDIGTMALDDIRSPSSEGLDTVRLLMGIEPESLEGGLTSGIMGSARESVLWELVATAVSEMSEPVFAKRAMELVLDVIPAEQAHVLFCSKEFLRRPNFLCVVVMFHAYEKKVRGMALKDVEDLCRLFHDIAREMLGDEHRAAVFADLSQPEKIAAAIHGAIVP